MGVTIRRYIPEDYMIINKRPWDRLTDMRFPDRKTVAVNLARGHAYTMVSDDSAEGIVACAGIVPLWKGVGEGWAITSELVPVYRLSFARAVCKYMHIIIKELELERIQAFVMEGHIESIKWLEWMGFEYEGPMKKYIGGGTYIRYAWVKED